MAQNSQVSITVPAAVLTEARKNLEKVLTDLAPFMHALTPDERTTLPKMSNKTVSFVDKVISYSSTNPQFTPPFLDVDEMKIDYKAVGDLKPLLDLARQLCDNLDDTSMLSGSEAYTASLMYYRSVKSAAGQGIASAKAVYDDLQERFPGGKRTKVEAKTP